MTAKKSPKTAKSRRGPYLASRERNRKRIVEAARGVFRAGGFRDASVERLCAEAGVSTATFYAHFPDGRTALLDAVCTDMASEVAAAATAAAASGDLETIGKAFQTFAFDEETLALIRIGVAEMDQVRDLTQALVKGYADILDAVTAAVAVKSGRDGARDRADLYLSLLTGPSFHLALITGQTPSRAARRDLLARARRIALGD